MQGTHSIALPDSLIILTFSLNHGSDRMFNKEALFQMVLAGRC